MSVQKHTGLITYIYIMWKSFAFTILIFKIMFKFKINNTSGQKFFILAAASCVSEGSMATLCPFSNVKATVLGPDA